jgi:hypothetical protein
VQYGKTLRVLGLFGVISIDGFFWKKHILLMFSMVIVDSFERKSRIARVTPFLNKSTNKGKQPPF